MLSDTLIVEIFNGQSLEQMPWGLSFGGGGVDINLKKGPQGFLRGSSGIDKAEQLTKPS